MIGSESNLEILEGKCLGTGAFSQVYKCRLRSNSQLFALKVVDLSQTSKEDADNLRSEIDLHCRLVHPHIIRFYDSLQSGNMVYILLELAPKGCLFFYIHPKDGLPERLALRFFYQTALAVKFLHQQNLVHRDIKPENLLLDENFSVKLCDFGWSVLLDNPEEIRSSIAGTYQYMPPEIVFDRRHSSKADVWSLGVLLYEFLHGKAPFSGNSIDEMRQQFSKPNINIYNHISTETKELIKFLLKKNTNTRPNISQVLEHDAIRKNLSEISKPLTHEEMVLLVNNYRINTVGSSELDISHSLLRSLCYSMDHHAITGRPFTPAPVPSDVLWTIQTKSSISLDANTMPEERAQPPQTFQTIRAEERPKDSWIKKPQEQFEANVRQNRSRITLDKDYPVNQTLPIPHHNSTHGLSISYADPSTSMRLVELARRPKQSYQIGEQRSETLYKSFGSSTSDVRAKLSLNSFVENQIQQRREAETPSVGVAVKSIGSRTESPRPIVRNYASPFLEVKQEISNEALQNRVSELRKSSPAKPKDTFRRKDSSYSPKPMSGTSTNHSSRSRSRIVLNNFGATDLERLVKGPQNAQTVQPPSNYPQPPPIRTINPPSNVTSLNRSFSDANFFEDSRLARPDQNKNDVFSTRRIRL